jgi:hypothetical protein
MGLMRCLLLQLLLFYFCKPFIFYTIILTTLTLIYMLEPLFLPQIDGLVAWFFYLNVRIPPGASRTLTNFNKFRLKGALFFVAVKLQLELLVDPSVLSLNHLHIPFV